MRTCLWLTGLPCSGKTTIANLVKKRYPDLEVLDGDEIRQHLSKGLGFSREDRIENNMRIAYVASKIVKHGGDVLVACVSPYENGRNAAQRIVEREGGRFVLVYVKASAETCMARDPKGMWAKAVSGAIKHFTGHDDPYEEPKDQQLRLNTEEFEAWNCAAELTRLLTKHLRQLFIGRWQPLHAGHQHIIRQALEKGPVAIGVRDTEISDANPFSVAQRIATISEAFAGEDVQVFGMPDICSVNIGRKVGYDIVRYDAPEDIEAISGTAIRAEMKG